MFTVAERRAYLLYAPSTDQTCGSVIGECYVKEKGRAAASLSLSGEGRSGSVVGGDSLFLPQKKGGGCG